MEKTAQLFQCENETKILPTEGWIPPFGIAYIASYARQQGHEISMYSPLNGVSLEQMLKIAGKNVEVVGITTTASTYATALTIARAAKSNNPKAQVIFGGPQAAALAQEVIINRGPRSGDYCVDAVCHGDGVLSFNAFLEGSDRSKIPNIFYQDKNSVRKTDNFREDISRWPSIDYSYFDMRNMTSSYGEKFKGITPFKKGLGIMSGFGCAAKHQCGFCARTDRKLRLRPVEKFWEEVKEASNKWRVEYFFDLADSILDSPSHLKHLIETKPMGLSPRFRVFARADQLASAPKNINLLEKLGVYEVFIGFESGSDEILRAMKKDTSTRQNLNAAEALGERGIFIVGCFVLGALGETKKTLEESVRHAEKIQKISNNHFLVCGASPINVLPGSPWFSLIRNEENIRGKDDLDRDALRVAWYKNFCHVDAQTVEKYAEMVRVASGALMQYEKGTEKD